MPSGGCMSNSQLLPQLTNGDSSRARVSIRVDFTPEFSDMRVFPDSFRVSK